MVFGGGQDEYAHLNPCGHCGRGTSALVVHTGGQGRFLLCTGCQHGTYERDGGIFPPPPMAANVLGLPPDVEAAWMEARLSAGARAYTAAELMCRKILMHLAVDVAGSSAGESFKSYIEDLDEAGYISTGMKPIVEMVKDRGNDATHQLEPSSRAEAEQTLSITQYLLETVYGLRRFLPPPDPASTE